MSNEQLDPAVEVVHLRRLLDIQPGCLMRLGGDGVVLAANDAARTLLGMQSCQQALGRAFAGWIPPDQRDRWQAFTVQVIGGSPASVECDIIDASGHQQTTLLHGVPLTDHPDGVPSMAVAVRVVSGQRQLEAAVVEREEILRQLDTERQEARALLGEAHARQRQLEAAFEELAARHQLLTTERAAERQRVLELLDAIAVQHRQELMTVRSKQASTLADQFLTGANGQPVAESIDCPLVSVDDKRSP